MLPGVGGAWTHQQPGVSGRDKVPSGDAMRTPALEATASAPPSTLTGPSREGRAPHRRPPRPHVRTLPALPARLADDRRRKGTAHWTLARGSSLLASQRHSKALLRQILGHGWPSASSPENHGCSPERPKQTKVPPTAAGEGGTGAPGCLRSRRRASGSLPPHSLSQTATS